jgi:hypothetical protein
MVMAFASLPIIDRLTSADPPQLLEHVGAAQRSTRAPMVMLSDSDMAQRGSLILNV